MDMTTFMWIAAIVFAYALGIKTGALIMADLVTHWKEGKK